MGVVSCVNNGSPTKQRGLCKQKTILFTNITRTRRQWLFFQKRWCGVARKSPRCKKLKNSPLYDACYTRSFLPVNLGKRINGVLVPPLIIGDSAYGLQGFRVPPYCDRGNLTQSEVKFNKVLRKTRVVVENAFGRLKGCFRCMAKRLALSVPNACITISACCVPHNFCKLMKEQFNEQWLREVYIHADILQCDRNEKRNRQADEIRNAIRDYIA